jgi:hypothetical protein
MKDGVIRLRSGGTLGPSTTLSDFLAVYPDDSLDWEYGAHRSYGIGSQEVAGRQFSVQVQFSGEALEMVFLIALVGFENEELRQGKADNDEWLRIQSLPCQFEADWGGLSSVIDQKSGMAAVVVHYRSSLTS